jgi:hypothetical protein
VDALRTLHGALAPGGYLVDTQPLSPRPPVFAGGERLGSLDMREWAGTIASMDVQIERALDEGLFALEAQRWLVVNDVWDDGTECIEEVGDWEGTKVPRALAARIRTAPPPITLEQEVRLRLLART